MARRRSTMAWGVVTAIALPLALLPPVAMWGWLRLRHGGDTLAAIRNQGPGEDEAAAALEGLFAGNTKPSPLSTGDQTGDQQGSDQIDWGDVAAAASAGGAVGGAAGAAVGSVVPVVGTAVGGAVGAALGSLAGAAAEIWA